MARKTIISLVALALIAALAWPRAARAAWSEAAACIIEHGTLSSGTCADTASDDSARLVIAEIAGAEGYELNFNFSGVPSTANRILMNGYYNGNPGHVVWIEGYNWSTNVWDHLTANSTDLPSIASDQNYTWTLSSSYISGGIVALRIIHTSAGAPGHTLNVDRFVLDEDPDPTATPTATSTATATATSTATATATNTATATSTATATATATPTNTATPTITPTATQTPTATPMAAAIELPSGNIVTLTYAWSFQEMATAGLLLILFILGMMRFAYSIALDVWNVKRGKNGTETNG